MVEALIGAPTQVIAHCDLVIQMYEGAQLQENSIDINVLMFMLVHVIAGKPNSKYDSEDGEEDPHFKKIIARANQEPTKKFAFPQTEAQEIGWVTRPLVSISILGCKNVMEKITSDDSGKANNESSTIELQANPAAYNIFYKLSTSYCVG